MGDESRKKEKKGEQMTKVKIERQKKGEQMTKVTLEALKKGSK